MIEEPQGKIKYQGTIKIWWYKDDQKQQHTYLGVFLSL